MILKYRSVFENLELKQTELQIPGWAGSKDEFKNEKKVQPFLCKPFVDAANYGISIYYNYETTLKISNNKGKIEFIPESDWQKDKIILEKLGGVPVGAISENHFGINSGLDLQVPENYALRIENHPAYYNQNNYPCAIPGHLETTWWSSLFFIVFKNPTKGKTIILKKGMPIAQVFPVPLHKNIEIKEMSNQEKLTRRENFKIIHHNRHNISQSYKDNLGNSFDHTYKEISKKIKKNGFEWFAKFLNELSVKVGNIKNLGLRLFKKNAPLK
jgi:hypothetical protein